MRSLVKIFLRGEKFFKNSFWLLHTVLEYDKFTSVNFLPAPCATVRLWTTGGGAWTSFGTISQPWWEYPGTWQGGFFVSALCNLLYKRRVVNRRQNDGQKIAAGEVTGFSFCPKCDKMHETTYAQGVCRRFHIIWIVYITRR